MGNTIKLEITTYYLADEDKTIVRLHANCEQLGEIDERIINWYAGEPNNVDTEKVLLNFLAK